MTGKHCCQWWIMTDIGPDPSVNARCLSTKRLDTMTDPRGQTAVGQWCPEKYSRGHVKPTCQVSSSSPYSFSICKLTCNWSVNSESDQVSTNILIQYSNGWIPSYLVWSQVGCILLKWIQRLSGFVDIHKCMIWLLNRPISFLSKKDNFSKPLHPELVTLPNLKAEISRHHTVICLSRLLLQGLTMSNLTTE